MLMITKIRSNQVRKLNSLKYNVILTGSKESVSYG
jgi:hypothetical protein